MAFIRKNKIWRLPDHEITPEAVFQNRREFLRLMGFSTTALAASFIVPRAWAKSGGEESARAEKTRVLPRLETNPAYPIRRPLTSERVAATYNNFYEFSPEKEGPPTTQPALGKSDFRYSRQPAVVFPSNNGFHEPA